MKIGILVHSQEFEQSMLRPLAAFLGKTFGPATAEHTNMVRIYVVPPMAQLTAQSARPTADMLVRDAGADLLLFSEEPVHELLLDELKKLAIGRKFSVTVYEAKRTDDKIDWARSYSYDRGEAAEKAMAL